MPKASVMQNTFGGGELSPLLFGRQDIKKYKQGLATSYNGVSLVQGGWTRRPGTVFLKTTKFGGTKESRLLPFEFSVTQTYILEFGDVYIRFFTNQGILAETAQTPTAITQADPGVVTINSHGYSNGDRLQLGRDIGGMHQLWSREVQVANQTANTFELQDIYGNDIDTSGFDAFTSGGSVSKIIEVVSPYAEADLATLRITQSADVLYMFHPDYVTRKLIRNSATSWTLSETDFLDGPYIRENTTATTLNPSAATGTGITIVASAVTGINNDQGFLSTDVGRLIRINHSGTWGYAKITAVGSTTSVTADVKSDFNGTSAQSAWRLGLYSDTTGYPVYGTFFEDRLWHGGCSTEPQRIDSSKSGDYENLAPSDPDGTVADDNAISYTLNSSQVNNIRWMEGTEKALLVGTAGAEWPIRPSSLSEAITPSNISGKPSSRRGSANIAPILAGDAALFVQRAKRKVREFSFTFEKDGFVAPDLNLLADHITIPSIEEIVYFEQPQSVMWSRRSDGALLGFTYEREQDVVGWHEHELAGDSDDAGTIAQVESLATVPSAAGDRDELYLIVKRYINGTTERYVEVMSKIWEVGDLSEDAFYVDAGITINSVGGTSTIQGLAHLEGESVTLWVDGAIHPAQTVTNAEISLTVTANTIAVGEGYSSIGEILPLEAGAADGVAQGKIKDINRVGFWLLDTLGLQYGPDEDTLSEILVRNWGGNWGEATPLFTGVVRLPFEGTPDRVGQLCWHLTGPTPCTVLAVMPQLNTQDDS